MLVCALYMCNIEVNHCLLSASTLTLIMPSTHHSTLGDHTFPAVDACVWNALPLSHWRHDQCQCWSRTETTTNFYVIRV